MRARIILPLLLLFAACVAPARGAAPAYGVRVVVLDAGHGGNDPGASYAGAREKDITLKVVLRLGRRIEQEMPGVKVVYTRKTDKALAATKVDDLQERANIANRANGDLFISVHVNAARSPEARGVETLIMGETPKEQRYNENALFDTNRDDLLDMSDERQAAIIRAYIQNLQFTYGEYSMAMARCIQNNYVKAGRQSRGVKPQLLRVLYATNMPGVLTEIGFLSNKEEAAFLKSDKGIDRLVDALFKALNDYSEYVLGSRRVEEELEAVSREEAMQSAGAALQQDPASDAKPAAKPADARREEREAKRAEKNEKKQQQKAEEEREKLYDARLYRDPKQAEPAEPARQTPDAAQSDPVRYTVQVLASRKSVSLQSAEFKEYRGRVRRYEGEGSFKYRYGVGEYATRAEALQAAAVVRRTFPQAFVTAVQGGRVVTPKP